jgi:hypothetical protein
LAVLADAGRRCRCRLPSSSARGLAADDAEARHLAVAVSKEVPHCERERVPERFQRLFVEPLQGLERVRRQRRADRAEADKLPEERGIDPTEVEKELPPKHRSRD